MTHFPFLKNLSRVHYGALYLSILDSHEATPAIMTHVTMAEHIKSTHKTQYVQNTSPSKHGRLDSDSSRWYS